MVKHYVLFFILLTAFTARAQQPKVETPCVLLNKLVDDFPNNCKQYVGEFIRPNDDDMWSASQNDTRFESKITLPGARETYFYNELYREDNIFYTKFYEGSDTTQARIEYEKWHKRIEDCSYVFGTMASLENDSDVEKKLYLYPFDITGDMAKKYHQLVMELKIFKGVKIKDNGQTVLNYTVELRVMRDRTQ